MILNTETPSLFRQAVSMLAEAGLDAGEWHPTPEPEFDATVELRWPKGSARYRVVVKSQLRPSTVGLLPTAGAHPILVVAAEITRQVGRMLRDRGIDYIDSRGNACLRAPGLWLLVEGRLSGSVKPPTQGVSTAGLFTPAAMPVLLAVLSKPSLLTATTREIEHIVPSSLGTVHKVLRALREQSSLVERGVGELSGGVLLDRWVEAYLGFYRERLGAKRYQTHLDGIGAVVDALGGRAFLSGEAAAERLGWPIRPVTVDAYVSSSTASVLRSGRLRLDPEGPVILRQPFWSPELTEHEPGHLLAPSAVIYADLVAVDDPRLSSLAKEFRKSDPNLRRLDHS